MSDQAICACGTEGQVTDTGSASGRKHYRCPKCGRVWREKNPAAVALGSLGGKARSAALSPEERSQHSTMANEVRWGRVRAAKQNNDES